MQHTAIICHTEKMLNLITTEMYTNAKALHVILIAELYFTAVDEGFEMKVDSVLHMKLVPLKTFFMFMTRL